MSGEIRRLAWQVAAHAEWHAMTGARSIPKGMPLPESTRADVAPVDSGVQEAPVPSNEVTMTAMPPPTTRESAAAHSAATERPAATVAAAAVASVAGPVAAAGDLEALQAAIGDCQLCRLAKGRTKLVFGVGNPSARLMFVGEGPGRDEDLKGEPFVGRAGMLLTDIIEKGMRLARSDVYICNVVKCRPPENRNPEPDEVETCSPFLLRQIALVQPEVIVALGKFAAQTLLQTKTPITRLRGQWFEYQGVPLMPTLHPAYLLRNPGDKKLVWQDIKSVMARLGMPS